MEDDLKGETVMRVIALIGHGPQWITGKSVYEQGPVVQEHLVSMRNRYDEGALLLGGPFARGGGIAVLDVDDEAAAAALMDADPAVGAGVMVYELHRMRAYFDAFAGVRTGEDVDVLTTR
jgi:uncharacterized protein YciI